ncbi:hypothetical protein BY458DRAFT_587372 [Sporodiniella umbellata]|nr:hypothetical protein BY458DRAFT_587372 [Sporodiniella umbellata]
MSSFWRTCNEENECHCDWRVILTDCVERNVLSKIYMMYTIWNIILTVSIIVILYNRIVVKKLVIFERVPHTVFVRPKPIESMLVWAFFFVLFRAVNYAVILFEVDVNRTFLAVFYEVIWECGLCAATCYVFGLANAASNTSEITKRTIFFSRKKVDILFSALVTVPFVFNCVCAALTGVYADRNDYQLASVLTSCIYYVWTAYCIFMTIVTSHFGIHSLRIFKILLKNHSAGSRPSIENIKSSMLRMKLITTILVITYLVYAAVACAYAAARDEMMINPALNIAECFLCQLFATASVTFILFALIFNPKLLNPLSMSLNTSHTETLELSVDKPESQEGANFSKPFQLKQAQSDIENQKKLYNIAIEAAHNEDSAKISFSQSTSQVNLIIS